MEQPELGIKISKARKLKGITQKELSESCNIDIRTIQRIEAGDVIPRTSTLKLIEEALSIDLIKINDKPLHKAISGNFLIAILFIGILYFVSMMISSPIFPKNNFLEKFNLIALIVYTVAGTLFYYGYYRLGVLQQSIILRIASILVMVLIPLFFISILISTDHGIGEKITQIIGLIMGINSILLGIGLLTVQYRLINIYKFTGILQIIIAPFFIIPKYGFNLIGFWLSIPFILLLLTIVFFEFKENQKLNPINNVRIS